MQTATKIWDQAAIHELLESSPLAVARAVIAIYARQTDAEKNAKTTTESNGVGFSGYDAEFLSDIAQKLPRYEMRMTPAQLAKVRPKMKRYWKQLLEVIEAKGQPVSMKPASIRRDLAKSLNRPIATPRARGDLARQF